MKSSIVIAAAAALVGMAGVAIAQPPETKPGNKGASEFAPGQRATEPGGAKQFAPGQQMQLEDDTTRPGASEYAPGQQDRDSNELEDQRRPQR